MGVHQKFNSGAKQSTCRREIEIEFYAFLTTDDLKRASPPGSTVLTPPAVYTMSAISVENDYF